MVAGLLQRAQDERGERLAAAARLARRTSITRSPTCAGERAPRRGESSSSGDGRRRHTEVGELGEQQPDRLRVGPLVDAVQRLAPSRRRAARRRPRSRGSSAPRPACARAARPRARRARRRPGRRTRSSISGRLDRAARRGRSAAAAARRSASRRARASIGEPSTPLAAGEQPLRLAVGEARVDADHRAVEDRLARSGRVERDLDRDAEPVVVRPQRAGVVGELGRQHRRDAAGHVGRERAPRRRRGRAACRPGRSARRRRCAPRRAARRPRGRTEIASSKSFAVSGSIVKVTSSRRSARPSSLGSGASCGSNSTPRALLRRAGPRARPRCRRPGRARARPAPARARSRTTARSPAPASPQALRVERRSASRA